jgi:hypothetical protein
MDILKLAELELEREGLLNKHGGGVEFGLLLDRAKKIRKYLDLQEDNKIKTQFKKGV